MNFRKLALRCECGLAPPRISEVGLTAHHELVVYWRCSRCQRTVYVVKDLTDWWRDCPGPEIAKEPLSSTTVNHQREDARFLHAMGIEALDHDQES